MTKLVVVGDIESEQSVSYLDRNANLGIISVKHSVTLSAFRDGATEHELTVDDDEIIELTLSDGRKHWISASRLESELAEGVGQRGLTGMDVIRLPSAYPLGGNQRGLGNWVIKGLKILGVDLVGSITEIISERVEGKLESGPGLFCLDRQNVGQLQPATELDFSKPILVFLHGTASSTEGSFGDLWRTSGDTLTKVFNHYDDQVLAFQHHTLSLSPIENALELLGSLKKMLGGDADRASIQLDIVSHSRGGLVGEVLCRGTAISQRAFDEDDLSLFSTDGYERDKQALTELNKLMSLVDLKISKFIRVACPARGTTLAGGRLDRYLSGMVNVVGETTGLGNSVLFDSLSTLMLGVIKKRTEPQEVPGLEAMMPGSPTVKLLNRPDIKLTADLHVLGGDISPSGIWHRLKVFLTDLYYQEDHDLVVNSIAMLGGAPRINPVQYWLDEGAKVNHFLYFNNNATVSRLEAALVTDSNSSYRELSVNPAEVTRLDYQKRTAEPQPIVFVLPGIMGSHLARRGKRIWLDFIQLARGGVDKLNRQTLDIEPDGPIEDAYADLLEYLAVSHDVRPFAYDWRKPIAESAALLEAQIRLALETAESNDKPVRLIAHSMGGLVVRAMLGSDSGKKTWARMCRLPGCRFIMLGTPNRGSHAIANMLIGRDSLLKKLAWLDIKHDYAELQETVVDFDGVLELLPHEGSVNLFDPDDWDRLHEMDTKDRIERPDQRGIFSSRVGGSTSAGISWKRPDSNKLANAAGLQRLLSESPIDPKYMHYIAGTAPATAKDIHIDENAAMGRKVCVSATSDGDGRVPWDTGIPAVLRADNTYFLNVPHGDLANNPDSFPAILDLLVEGRTDKISRAPVGQRSLETSETTTILPEAVDYYPDRNDLLSAALGGRLNSQPEHTDKVPVRIIHGNLARAEFPVLVGHYEGDTIVSAESYLDRQLNGRLRERHLLGLYPARLGSSAVVLNSQQRVSDGAHPGAIVVGLSTFGDLTPGRISSTIASGLMQYAITVLEQTREQHSGQDHELPSTISAPFCALLIGASSNVGISDSLYSILRAVRQVNQQLKNRSSIASEDSSKRCIGVSIDKVDIIELWEDKAVQATRALRKLSKRHDLKDQFDIEPRLTERADGCTRASVNDMDGWWQRMRITADPSGVLQFETFAEQARVDSYLQPTQRRLVDRLLSHAVGTAVHDASLSRTLFELLFPNELKEYALDRRDMVLMVDKSSAKYPWELLQDGSDPDSKPLSVESAMIRQLVSDEFRVQPVLAQDQSALVIGDPEGNKNTSVFPSLLGARIEARQVARLLNSRGYSPVIEMKGDEATALTVLSALYERPYKILHIAAHGVFEQPINDMGEPIIASSPEYGEINETTPRVSGVVLGDGMYLTPVEIGKMRSVPQLVFVNCCYLGTIGNMPIHDPVQYNQLAASFAQELIKMGVRGVIAAGWAVDDDAAALFATEFYKAMLVGESFGQAVFLARRRIYSETVRSGSNTWGAYQCYGDPEFAINDRVRHSGNDRADLSVSASDMQHKLKTLSANLEYAEPDHQEWAETELELLLNNVPKHWLESGALCASIAEVYARLGQFGIAVDYYMQAASRERGDVPLKALEQLVNMIARSVTQSSLSGLSGTEDKNRVIKQFNKAESVIDSVLSIEVTQERLALKGSIHKRWAMLATKNQQVTQLKKMANTYKDAYELGVNEKSENAFYPLQNLIAAQISLAWCEKLGGKDRLPRKALKLLISELRQFMHQDTVGSADFWTMCKQPDFKLLQILDNGIISEEEEEEVVRAYVEARQRGGTQRDMQTIIDHIQFFLSVAKKQISKQDKRNRLCSALERIEAGIRS